MSEAAIPPELRARVRVVAVDHVREWLAERGDLAALGRPLGRQPIDPGYLEDRLGVPPHVRFVVAALGDELGGPAPADCLDSISFHSLCKGLFLPLSAMQPEKAAHLFGLVSDPPPDTKGREALLAGFLARDLGLSEVHKLSCVLGDPFRGRPSGFRRESLLRLLMSVQMVSRRQVLDRLTLVGDPAVLYAESRTALRGDPPLTAVEVLETLRLSRDVSRRQRFDLLRALWARCGKLEAYFLAKLLLRKAALGFEYEGTALARALAERHGADVEHVEHAMALTDAFEVARVLAEGGGAALSAIRLRPLVPVRPALASGTTHDIERYPVWVERKYDGVRLMLHKSTDAQGSVLCGAYTRTRRDWLELVPGLDATIRAFPMTHGIVDGELYGTVLDLDGARPATVYEVYASLQGEAARPVTLRFAAFDVLYVDGLDLTQLPLRDRRQHLSARLGPVAGAPLPVPIALAEGQLAASKDDLSRLYHHFRAQGYEGVIAKDLDGPYALSRRDKSWRKRKPEITLDLALLGAVLAVTTKERAGTFGSYVIGARGSDGGFVDVGDVAGVDRARDAEIQQVIMREGLLTGRRFERASASGARPGMELRPHIVVTVRFEGVVRDVKKSGELSLRDPKIVMIRADKAADEVDGTAAIEELYLRQRVG